MLRQSSTVKRSRQRGLSIVELMVGVAVGLFVVGGATKLFVDYLMSNRRQVLETRVSQDLRAAADLVARDLRRAGYWRNAQNGVWTAGVSIVAPNPYLAITSTAATAIIGSATYSYDKDGVDLDAGVAQPSSAENFGYDVSGGALRFNSSGGAQQLTDPGSLTITQFQITPSETTSDLYTSCPCNLNFVPGAVPPVNTCPAGLAADPNRVRLKVRQFTIDIAGQSVSDSSVTRRLSETVRVRNDALIGSYCP